MTTTLPACTTRSLIPAAGRDICQSVRDERADPFGRFWPDQGADGTADSAAQIRIQALVHLKTALVLLRQASDIGASVEGEVRPHEIEIEIGGHALRISGQRNHVKEEKGKTWHHVERDDGRFARTVTLPCDVPEHRAKAEYAADVLTLSFPKSQEAKTRHIKVEVKGKDPAVGVVIPSPGGHASPSGEPSP